MDGHQMDMRKAVLWTIEGACGILEIWNQLHSERFKILSKAQQLSETIEQASDKEIEGTPEQNEDLKMIVAGLEEIYFEIFDERSNIKLPYVRQSSASSSIFSSFDITGAQKTEKIRYEVAIRELRKNLGMEVSKLIQAIKTEVDELKSQIRVKENNISRGQDMFYGTLAVESGDASSGPSTEATSTCAVVVDLVRQTDSAGGMACLALSGLLRWQRENEIRKDPTKDTVAQWRNVRDWEKYATTGLWARTVELLEGRWEHFTEVDLLADKAGEFDLQAMEILRQLLCVQPKSIPYQMRSHVRRALVKQHNREAQEHNNQGITPSRPILLEDGDWPQISRCRILRTLMNVLRNALQPFFEAKQKLKLYSKSPLRLLRRQAILDIAEMASNGNEIASDYILDELCSSKDWSIRQIALGRSARILPKANEKDKMGITLKLLSAALGTEESGIVQETAETAMISALKAGLNRKPDFVDMLNKIAHNLLTGLPRSSPSWAAHDRIQKRGFEGTVKPRAKKVSTAHSDLKHLRDGYKEQA